MKQRHNKLFIIGILLFCLSWSCVTKKKPPPRPRKPKKEVTAAAPEHTLYRVSKNQKLSALAQQLKLSVQEIKSLNPGLEEDLKVGQQIKIPVKKEAAEPAPEPARSYSIAMLLPFNIDMELDTADADENQERVSQKAALEFYEGAVIAFDSLEAQGLKCKVNVYDVENDSAEVKRVLTKEELKQANLLIGPFSNAYLAPVARFAKENRIGVVSPLSSTQASFTDNPYVAIATPSVGLQCRKMAEYLVEKHRKDNIILLHRSDPREMELVSVFKNIISRQGIAVKDIATSKVDSKSLGTALSSVQNNIVIVPSSNEAFVIQALNVLNNRSDRHQITVVGLPTWEKFESADVQVLQNLNTLIFKAAHVDMAEGDVSAFRRKYYKLYKTEPSVYAYQGFGVAYYYGQLLLKSGNRFWDEMSANALDTYHTTFSFKRNGTAGAFENTHINILEYKDFRLQKKN
jgi:ABC-type branched-subunit amino acid transport system substrate-binding protein